MVLGLSRASDMTARLAHSGPVPKPRSITAAVAVRAEVPTKRTRATWCDHDRMTRRDNDGASWRDDDRCSRIIDANAERAMMAAEPASASGLGRRQSRDGGDAHHESNREESGHEGPSSNIVNGVMK